MASAQAPGNAMPPGMMQQQMDPLAELRDIHLPTAVEQTLTGPGWWLLALLVAITTFLCARLLYRLWRAGRYRREAVRALDELLFTWQEDHNAARFLGEVQALLKRTALTRFPRADVASLTGEAWVAFLDHSVGTREFSLADAEVLIDGSYREEAHVDVRSLYRLAEFWIRHHHPKHYKRHQSEHVAEHSSEAGRAGANDLAQGASA